MDNPRELRVSDELPVDLVSQGDLFLSDSKNEYLVLPAGVCVPLVLVDQLSLWKIPTIFTYGTGKFLEQNLLSDNTNIISLNNDDENIAISEIREFYKNCVGILEEIFIGYRESQTFTVNVITDLLHDIINMLRERRRFLIRLNLYQDLCKDYFVNHALQTAILSLLVGDSLKLPAHRLIDVGIVALLHDVGFYSLPAVLYDKQESLTEEEQRLYSGHVIIGYKNLKSFSFSPDVLLGVLQHHEYLDGTGYLQGLSGEQISLNARIVGLTSYYHQQISKRPHGAEKLEHIVLTNLIKDMRKKYNENLINQLISSLSFFPIGSYVKLSDGSKGIVIDSDLENVRYPVVKILFSAEGSCISSEILAVKSSKNLYIIGVLSANE